MTIRNNIVFDIGIRVGVLAKCELQLSVYFHYSSEIRCKDRLTNREETAFLLLTAS